MATKSVLRVWTGPLYDGLAELHAAIRGGSEDMAVALYQQLIGYGLIAEAAARQDIHREAEFLRVVDASRAIGPKASGRSLTPRQAFIGAALGGWYGDDPSSWSSPVPRRDLLAFANSYYQGPQEHLEVALRGLLAERLFFEVHPGVFAEPCYFCSYDPEFLPELSGAEEHVKMWTEWRDYHDRHSRGWRHAGLCWGQGRQGGVQDDEVGVCLGTSCCCFADYASERCTRELRYDQRLLDLFAVRREPFAQ
jgi:hypothetical protein